VINPEEVSEDAYGRDKYEHIEEDKTKRNMFTNMLRKRVEEDERNNIILVTGQTGTGKSWSAISIAYELDNKFDETRVTYSAQEFMEVINKDLPVGSCMILDEAGVTINSRMFMTTVNRLIGYVNQTVRKKRWTMFFCVPA
jgi:DNA replication protein DnaC